MYNVGMDISAIASYLHNIFTTLINRDEGARINIGGAWQQVHVLDEYVLFELIQNYPC